MQNSWITTELLVCDRYSLASAVNRAVDPDGGDALWSFHLLGVAAPDGRTIRIEAFPEEAWDAARARFDELSSADPRTPTVENDATRRTRHDLDLLLAGRYDELDATLQPNFERIDRRHGVAGSPITSAADYLASLRAIMDQFDALSFEPIAVRGERHHLSRVTWGREDDFHVTAVVVFAFDEAGLGVANITFDEADLVAAVAELDERYMAGEGAEHAEMLRLFNANSAGVAAGDYAALESLTAPDFEYVDHRLVSWGVLDRRGFADMRRGYDDLPTTIIATKLYFGGRSLIARTLSRGVADDGTEVEWLNHCVFVSDGAGLGVRSELFDENDWDAALARFDELTEAESRES